MKTSTDTIVNSSQNSYKTKYSAKALIISKKDPHLALLIQEQLTNGKIIFDLPGGKIEVNETPLDALNRELSEELDIRVEVNNKIGQYWFLDERLKVKVICHTYLCQVNANIKVDLTKNPAEYENILGIKWMKINEILNSKLPGIVPSLKNLFKKIEKN